MKINRKQIISHVFYSQTGNKTKTGDSYQLHALLIPHISKTYNTVFTENSL